MSRTDPQFKLRMPASLRVQIEQAALQAHRSINAEIVFRLLASFSQEATDHGASTTVDSRVSAPPARTGLRLLCVLDLTDNTPRYIPACGMSALPPRVCHLGKWGPRLPAGLRLRETHATRPAPEVLARYLRHRQSNAACPHGTPEAQARGARLGVNNHGRA